MKDKLLLDKEYSQVVGDIYSVGNGELLSGLIERLQSQGLISKSLDLEDVLESIVKPSEKKIITEKTAEILEKRKKILGYGTITGYHTSTREYEVGSRILAGLEGKVYFSDLDSLYAARGRKSRNFVYKVSAEGKHQDVRDGWYYSRTPLRVLGKWTIGDFMEKHKEAGFR